MVNKLGGFGYHDGGAVMGGGGSLSLTVVCDGGIHPKLSSWFTGFNSGFLNTLRGVVKTALMSAVADEKRLKSE